MKFLYATGSRPLDGYTIKRGIGIGGFGEVYFALSDAGKEVALKRILRNTDIELRGESQCLNLKHANLIYLFDIRYDQEGQAWVIMEYVAGESLSKVIDRHPSGMPLAEVDRWFAAIAAGVHYLHDHGIVHRDLKPDNVFTDEDVIKIGDYGLSKYISYSRRGAQTESVGTSLYMAPEIGKGEYGKEIDIYALGVMLFEMVTGNVPFDGESSQEIIIKHLTDTPKLNHVPEPYASVIRKALAKDPKRRYPTVAAMQQALSAPVSKTPSSHESAEHGLDPYFIDDSVDAEEPTREPAAPAPIVLGELKDRSHYRSSSRPVLHIDGDSGPYAQGELIAASSPGALAAPPVEPLMAAAKSQLHGLATRWHALGWAPKLAILISSAALTALTWYWMLLGLGVAGCCYGVYYAAWRLLRPAYQPPPYRPGTAARYQGAAPVMTYVDKDRRLRELLASRSWPERLGQLSGSLLVAAAVSGIASLAAAAVDGVNLAAGGVGAWSFFAWVTFTATISAWSLLLAGKFWEGEAGETILRRFALIAIGLGVGVASYLAGVVLSVPFEDSPAAGQVLFSNLYPPSMYGLNHSPSLPTFLLQFAVLFGVVRWWRHADPLRRSRFQFLPVIAAALLSLLLPLPQPWGLLLAVIISIVVQLSAPWLSPTDRQHAAE